jgi:hypothetical protein
MAWLDILRPHWKHSDPAIRLEAVKKLTREKLLGRIAAADPDPGIRYVAKQKAFVRRLIEASCRDCRGDFGGLGTQERTESAYARPPDGETWVRGTHFRRGIGLGSRMYLLDSGELARSTWHADYNWITHEYHAVPLKSLCAEEAAEWARALAETCAKGLTDAALLAEIILDVNMPEETRVAAVGNPAFADQHTLARLATGDSSVGVRLAAADKLADKDLQRSVYEDFARTDSRAVCRLTDERLLAEIAKTTTDEWICGNAFEKLQECASRYLGDQELLAHVAMTSYCTPHHEWAVERLTDQALLAQIVECAATRRELTWAHTAAVEKLTDPAYQPLLVQLALGSDMCGVSQAAARKITDPKLLAEIAATALDEGTRQEARRCSLR